MQVDENGRLWLADYALPEFVPTDAPRWWTVFAETGRPLARIQLEGILLDVSTDAVLLLEQDDLACSASKFARSSGTVQGVSG